MAQKAKIKVKKERSQQKKPQSSLGQYLTTYPQETTKKNSVKKKK